MDESVTSGKSTEQREEQRKLVVSTRLLHLLVNAVFGLSVFAAFWHTAHPILTLVVMCMTVLTFLSIFLPDKGFWCKDNREILQYVLIFCALLWMMFRVMGGTPPDKLLVESFAVAGVGFALTRNMKDYMILFLLSLILVLYGSVYPRSVYIHLFPLILLLSLGLAYYTRSIALAGGGAPQFPQFVFRRSWRYLLLHALLVCAFLSYFSSVFPSPFKHGSGYVTSSFMTYNKNNMPTRFQDWFETGKTLSDKSAPRTVEATSTPDAVGQSGPPVNIPDAPNSLSTADGTGSGAPSDDLVMTVRCPVKLYWLAGLYDGYDGKEWTTSEAMRKQKVTYSIMPVGLIGQEFVVEKWRSRALCAAFLPRAYFIKTSTTKQLKNERFFFCERLPKDFKPPAGPFSYSVQSSITTEPATRGSADWCENLKPAHYLQLPENKISPRLKILVAKICDGKATPYAKALALRDHLRTNFTYAQFSARPPEDRETADFFVFELKEGHCEYFALALAVMARISGLPARVATGYSPGDFNTLTGLFEVYERHAHAWTQIFIEGKGWLTFDATPPSAVTSKTTPSEIGLFMDPFGDDWRVRPPELSPMTQDYLKTSFLPTTKDGSAKKVTTAPETPLVTKILMNIPTEEEEMKAALQDLKKLMLPPGLPGDSLLKNLYLTARANVMAMLTNAASTFASLIRLLAGPLGVVLISLAVATFTLYRFLQTARERFRRARSLNRCLSHLRVAETFVSSNHAECVKACYRATRDMLELKGLLPSQLNMELFAYGEELRRRKEDLGSSVLSIFFVYSKLKYGELPISRRESEVTLAQTKTIERILLGSHSGA